LDEEIRNMHMPHR